MLGKKLAHYEITSQLGKGGMGEVYQAKDTKLGRDVAIKVLPDEFALDPDRVARFQREAKLLAALNHSNIAAIYGLEESEGVGFLVLELVEGETLADRLKRGSIPVEESLKLALQIAEALEAAHEKGIIHRDLKPANIKVTPEGKVKVLDFGLAKAFAGEQAEMVLSDSPTLSVAATRQGIILGTASYMSPEQARGKAVDRRSDVWAFGCVLYEMLAGQAAFSGEDVTDILAAVIRSDPEWKRLPVSLHWRLREVLEQCLEKEAGNRYGSVSDTRIDIKKVIADPNGIYPRTGMVVESRGKRRVGITWIAAAVIVAAVIIGAVFWMLKPEKPGQVMRFYYELPDNQQFITLGMPSHSISPDGRQFAYSTLDGLYLRSVDAFDAQLIPGADRATQNPFFSPDNQWVGYYSMSDEKMKKIAVGGGAPITLCDSQILLGAIWYPDDTILYAELGTGILRISANGGNPEVLLNGYFAAPEILPDGNSLLFANLNTQPFTTMVKSPEMKEPKTLFAGLGAWYSPTGHLVYNLDNNLFAVPFDLETLNVTGSAASMVQGGTQHFMSRTGTLVYIQAAESAKTMVSLVWVDRTGKEEPLGEDFGDYGCPRISPDGTRVALTVVDSMGKSDIWIKDMDRETMTRLTFDGLNGAPLWAPDGKRVAYSKETGGLLRANVYWKAADGTGEEEKLAEVTDRMLLPWSWSADGKTLALFEINSLNAFDIGILSMDGDHKREALLEEKHLEIQPKISPDGNWLAYASDESGRFEIYVRPFPDVLKGKCLVSTSGGDTPLWSPAGGELFYRSGNDVVAVKVETNSVFKAGKPETLFNANFRDSNYDGENLKTYYTWDIHPDGKRFLMLKPVGSANGGASVDAPRRVNVILNWNEELKERVPVE